MKLTNEDIWRIIERFKRGLSTGLLASQFSVSPRRIQQIIRHYKLTGEYLKVIRPGRKSCNFRPDGLEDSIISLRKKHHMGASYMAKIFRTQGIKVDNNYIHNVLREKGMAREEPNKQKRRKPWVRYERQHSLSAGHMDWTEYNGKQVCVVLDDASRKILAGDEFNSATTENSLKLVQEVLDKYGHIRKIREIITDHGCQFYANRRDKEGDAEHTFELFLAEKGIKHVLCRYKHPQSNGKVERWFQTYKKFRQLFESFEEFVDWYNNRPHGSLDMATPNQAFDEKLQGFVLRRFLECVNRNEIISR